MRFSERISERTLRWLLPLIAALILTWPMALHFPSQAIGSVDGDGPKHLWNLWWMRAEFFSGPLGLLTDRVNFPDGMRLYPIEPLNGVFAVLLPLPPILLSNLLALLHLWLLGVCAGWLGRAISGDEAGGLSAGLLAQGSSFAAFTLHVGVGELRQVWWIPLGLALAVEARAVALDPGARGLADRRLIWRYVLLGLCLAGAVLSCFYHGFFLATALSTWALITLRPRPRLLAGYALAAILSLSIALPVIRTFSASYEPSRPQDQRGGFVDWMRDWRQQIETYRLAALDPAQALTPRTGERQQADRQRLAYTGGRYLGVLAVGLALAGLIAAPGRAIPWLTVTLLSAVLAMGTVPWWQGEQVTMSGGRILLPLAWINRALAYFAEPLNFPARFLSVTSLGIALLGGLAVARWPRLRWLVPLAVADIAWSDLVPWPRATFPMPSADGLADAAPADGAVWDASIVVKAASSHQGAQNAVIAGIDPETRLRNMALQIELDRPTQAMPVERVDHWATSGMAWSRALPLADALAAGRPGDRSDLWLLRDRGFTAIALTHDAQNGPQPQQKAALERMLGPGAPSPNATLWIIPAIDAPPEDQAAWRAAQAARAERFAPAPHAPQDSRPPQAPPDGQPAPNGQPPPNGSQP